MYYFKLVHRGVVVMTRALHAQGIGFHSGPGSTQFPPLVVFHYSMGSMGGIASVPALTTEK